MSKALLVHRGGCHCGKVRFEVDAPTEVHVDVCNCSICSMVGFEHLIVESGRFRLLAGQEQLSEYRFGTRTARHLFCARCGVKAFYVPRSHPDGFSVNLRCLDQSKLTQVHRSAFDGREWERNIEELRERT